MSPRFRYFATKVGQNRFLKCMLQPIYNRYNQRLKDRRNHLFRKNGVDVLQSFDILMNRLGINYSIFAGTLLGAIREKGFLKHDVDIDTVIFNDDYSSKINNALINNGFRLLHRYLVDDGKRGREETYEKDGVSIDIFYIYSDARFPTYQCDFHGVEGSSSHEDSMKRFGYVATRRIEFPVSRETVRVPFEGIMVNSIANAQEWLTYRYGKDYLIPNPSFYDRGDNPHMFEWTEVKAVMRY